MSFQAANKAHTTKFDFAAIRKSLRVLFVAAFFAANLQDSSFNCWRLFLGAASRRPLNVLQFSNTQIAAIVLLDKKPHFEEKSIRGSKSRRENARNLLICCKRDLRICRNSITQQPRKLASHRLIACRRASSVVKLLETSERGTRTGRETYLLCGGDLKSSCDLITSRALRSPHIKFCLFCARELCSKCAL